MTFSIGPDPIPELKLNPLAKPIIQGLSVRVQSVVERSSLWPRLTGRSGGGFFVRRQGGTVAIANSERYAPFVEGRTKAALRTLDQATPRELFPQLAGDLVKQWDRQRLG